MIEGQQWNSKENLHLFQWFVGNIQNRNRTVRTPQLVHLQMLL